MKLFKKVIPVLFLFSFLSISWIDFEHEKSEADCAVDLGPDIIINFWDSPQIHALIDRPLAEIEEITWSPSENLSCADCLDPVFTVTEMEDVCVSINVKFNDGCETSDEMCVFIDGCNGENFSENKINNITPQSISDNAEIELEIARFQFVRIEIVENDEVTHSLFEGWLGSSLYNLTLDFSTVPAGDHFLRVRLYPEDKFASITKL